jgi:serine/threonine-protein kinase
VQDEPEQTAGELAEFDLANRIDIVCDAYEQSWRSGAKPKLPAFLMGFEGAARDTLVAELLLLDCELRAQQGEAASCEEYLCRFPEFATVIAGVDFSTVASVPVTPKTDVAPRDKRFAQFELLERLGEGASGTVWKARDTALRRLVALKLPHLQTMTEAERARFRREGQACAQLHHPNIVAVYQVGDEQDRCYISSELVEGWSLRDWLAKQGRLSHVEAVTLVAQLADALQHAHEQGVIHRDLKPANVLVDHQGKPHLTDFGLARWTDQSVALTMEGHVVGTPAYMSPEQARGDAVSVDRRTDVYGLGAILYELLTGKPPFAGDMASVIQRVMNVDPPAPAKVDAKVPRDLETICLTAMQKSPAERYPSMQALGDDLRRYLAGEPIAARRTSLVGRSVRFAKRHKTLTGLVAACLVAAGALWGIAILAERNYRLQGYKTVAITTDPPGARMAFIPLSPDTFEPELYRKILAPGVSPVEIDLLPGDYLVVAVTADGRFHEVYRRVLQAVSGRHPGRHLNSWLLEDGKLGLSTVLLPAAVDHAGMTRIAGDESFPFDMTGAGAKLTYSLEIRPFFVDNTEFTVADDQENRDRRANSAAGSAQVEPFAKAVSEAENRGKRLPTEAEYLYLATNGGTTKYPWGDDWPTAVAIKPPETGDPFGPVGTPAFDKAIRYPTVVGLVSNKAEWVMPRLVPKYLASVQRQDVTLETQVYRGGSAATIAGDPRVTPEDRDPHLRGEANSKGIYPGLGFRCVRSAEPLVSYDEFE